MTAFLVKWSPLAIIALAWQLAPTLGLVSPSALPPITTILAALYRLTLSGDLPLKNAAHSLWRLFCGLSLAITVGITTGLLMAWYRPIRLLVEPLVRCIYPMPKSALIPVLLLWLGLGDMSKVALIFLGSLLPVLLATFNGVRGQDPMLFWSARSLGRSNLQVLREIALPRRDPRDPSRHPHRPRPLLHPPRQLRVPHGQRRPGLHDLLPRRRRRLRRHVRHRPRRLPPGLRRRPPLPPPHAPGPRMARLTTWLAASFSLLALLTLWALATATGNISPFLLPAPLAVVQRLLEDLATGDLATALLQTLTVALCGFALAAILGTALGIAMVRIPLIHWFFDPLVSLGFPMPKIAFLPIFMLWLGPTIPAKILIVAISAIFPVIAAATAGAQSVEKTMLWSAASLGASRAALLWQVNLPAATPQILTGLQIALPTALITTIVAEMLLGSDGLGGTMLAAMRFADSPGVFAGILAIALLGYALIRAMEQLRRHLLHWHPEAKT